MKLKINNNFFYCLILIMITVHALTYMLYASTLADSYREIYNLISVIFMCVLCIITILKIKKIYINFIVLWLFLIICWEILISKINGYLSTTGIPNIVIWPLLFINGFILFRGNTDEFIFQKKVIRNLVNLIVIILIIASIPLIQKHLSGLGNNGSVIFPTYYLITIFPFLLAGKRTSTNKILMLLIWGAILITTKRTGFLAINLGIIFYLLGDAFSKNTLKKRVNALAKVFSVLLVGGFLALQIILKFQPGVIERLLNLSEDGGSGRDTIWLRIITAFEDSSIYQKIMGHGYHAAGYVIRLKDRFVMAHNDYIETLYDYGIIGFILIIGFVLFLLWIWYRSLKNKDTLTGVYSYNIIIFIFLSMFSYYMVQSLIINYAILFWGSVYAIMLNNQDTNKVKRNENCVNNDSR